MEHTPITDELLHDLIAEPISIIELCARHGLTVEQLHDIIISPAYRHITQMIKAIQRARRGFLHDRITEVLERIALSEPTSPAHAETIRKAAAHLDRQLRKDTAQSQDQSQDPDPEAADPPPDGPQPTPDDQDDTEPDQTSPEPAHHPPHQQHDPRNNTRTQRASKNKPHANAPP